MTLIFTLLPSGVMEVRGFPPIHRNAGEWMGHGKYVEDLGPVDGLDSNSLFSQIAFSEAADGVAGHAHVAPGIHEFGAHGGVEVDGRGVPVEDFPLQARALFFDGDGGDALEQRFADAEAAQLWKDEEVFKVETGSAEPGGVVEEIERKSGRGAVVLRYKAEIERVSPESIPQQVGFGGNDGVGFALVGGECTDKCKDQRNISRSSRPDGSCHLVIVGCDTGHKSLRTRRTTMTMRSFESSGATGEVCGRFPWPRGLVLSRPLDLTWVVLEEAASGWTWIPERLFSFPIVRPNSLAGQGVGEGHKRNGWIP